MNRRKIFIKTICVLLLIPLRVSAQNYNDNFSEYEMLEEKPKFKGESLSAFTYWINSNIKYPLIARNKCIQGTVKVRFTINEKGKVVNAYIENSIHPLLDAEALRIVRKSPKWTPAIHDGVPVKVSYTIPVIFKLR